MKMEDERWRQIEEGANLMWAVVLVGFILAVLLFVVPELITMWEQ